MADRRESRSRESRRLNARGSREVVFCHQCELDWYRDNYGLTCPRCDGDITEIVSPETDPRLRNHSPMEGPPHHAFPPDPWRDANNSDPDEADIEEHVSHGPNGSTFVRTSRSSTPRNRTGPMRAPGVPGGPGGVDPGQEEIFHSFQSMLGNLLGPGVRIGQPGRSGPETLFSGPGWSGSIRVGGREGGPQFTGGAFTFTNRRGGGAAGRAPGGGPPMEDPFSMLDSMFGQMHPTGGHDHGPFAHMPGHPMPPHMPGVFAGLFNPTHAVSGDAVYSQEALDQIMSQLMEQHPTSNAPGPASKGDIDALPKKTLTEKLLGPEGKGECSVCMDDVHVGDEVVFLPCNHWFHEVCATAWLSEHNTCPICRKGIDGEANNAQKGSGNANVQQGQPGSSSQNPWTTSPGRRASTSRHSPSTSRPYVSSNRNEDRLNAIRNAGRVTPPKRRGSASEYDEPPSRRSTMPNIDARALGRGGRNVYDTPPASSSRSRRYDYDDDDGDEGSSSHRRRRESEVGGERRRDRDRERERDRDRMGYGSGSGSSAEYRRRSRAEGRGASGSGSGVASGVSSWLRDHWGGGGSRH